MDGKCSATTKSGTACSAQVWRDQLCRWHHPALEAKRVEGRRKGGQNKSARIRAAKSLPNDVLSTDDLRGMLGKTLKDVISGELEPAVGNAAAAIARAYVAVTEAAAVETLQAQVVELRALIAARGSA
jgi:hypothetical protein